MTQDSFSKSKFIKAILISTLAIAAGIFVLFYFFESTSLFIKIMFISASVIGMGWLIYAYLSRQEKVYKLIFTILVSLGVVIISYVLLKHFKLLDFFYSADSIKTFILNMGTAGKIIFFLIQFAQVAILPIPAVVTTLAGLLVYGPFETFIISTLAIIAGSLFSFFIWGRLLGYRMVSWIAGKDLTDKYREILNERGKYLLILMFIFPIFPDDILCMIAGITTMSAKFFIFVTLTIRPITVFIICYFGGGVIIPYSGWGLIAWPILLIIMGIIFYYTYKYRTQIEGYVTNKFLKKDKQDINKNN